MNNKIHDAATHGCNADIGFEDVCPRCEGGQALYMLLYRFRDPVHPHRMYVCKDCFDEWLQNTNISLIDFMSTLLFKDDPRTKIRLGG